MITGQLLFEALELGSWADISSDRQSHYNMLAEKLNQHYIASLQSSHIITGEAIHAIYRQRESTALSWHGISPRSRDQYDAIAEELNQRYLAPLQGLVRDYQTLQQETFDAFYQNVGSPEGLSTKMSELEVRTKQLFNAEQKEKE